MRLLAEYQNYKRRSLEDSLKASTQGKKEVFSELLETIDNLERALSVVEEEDKSDSFVKGVEMVYNSLVKKLEGLGLTVIDCTGNIDANLHHAVMTDNLEDYENDQIIEVLQKGYQLNEIIIRPAMVKVNQK
jgi:molecular chaperone GrpE